MRFYKVVTERNGSLRSVYEHPGAISYTPGQWVSSSAGPLFVFSSLSAAREFASVYGASVWRCHVRGVHPERQFTAANMYWLPSFSAEELAAAWRTAPTSPGLLLGDFPAPVPPGTRLVDAVKLVQKLVGGER